MGDIKKETKFTPSIGVIGCGSLGTAILRGLLTASNSLVKPSRIKASVVSKASANNLRILLGELTLLLDCDVQVVQDNVYAAKESDIVILACPPDMMLKVLTERGIEESLRGKLLISVLAGVDIGSMKNAIYGGKSPEQCWIVRALPNLAAAQQASATAVETFDQSMPADTASLATAILEQLGSITFVPASLANAGTIACGSTPAFIALFLDGLIDGAVAAGVPRVKADAMIAQVLTSTAALLRDGQRASTLRETVCSMPGCTIQGSLVLEDGGVRSAAAKAMKTAIEAASRLT